MTTDAVKLDDRETATMSANSPTGHRPVIAYLNKFLYDSLELNRGGGGLRDSHPHLCFMIKNILVYNLSVNILG